MSRAMDMLKSWDGTKHPRDKGKFATKGVHPNIASGHAALSSMIKRARTSSSVEDMSGIVAPNAMTHKDIGPIDFRMGVSGTRDRDYANGFGVAHIMARRAFIDGVDPEEFLSKIPAVIHHGKPTTDWYKDKGQTVERRNIEHGDMVAVIARSFKGQGNAWLLTAFKKKLIKSAETEAPHSRPNLSLRKLAQRVIDEIGSGGMPIMVPVPFGVKVA